jgi:hypothetical protein
VNLGWIKLHRQTLDNPVVMKDGDHLAVWVYLMLKATHKTYDIVWNGERKALTAGQLVTSRKSIAEDLKVSESKVERILKAFKSEQQIEQLSSSASRCISITKWATFQATEQQDEQRVDSDRTASGQQVDTNKNVKNAENVENVQESTPNPQGGEAGEPPKPKKRKRASKDMTAGELKKLRVKENTKAMKYIGALFGRGDNTLWNQYEAKALQDIGELVPDEVNLIGRYYRAKMEHGDDIRRRNVETLLNNWMGELDRAALWERNPKPKSGTGQGADKYREAGL